MIFLFKKLKNEFISIIYNSIKELKYDFILKENINVDISTFSDCSTNIAFYIASKEHKDPITIAKDIIKKINKQNYYYIEKISSIGPYINCFASSKYINETVSLIILKKMNFGSLDNKNKSVVLEHTSANPNGPLHIGHIRNSIIGDTLVRILKKAGWKVETQYYVNDIGRQIAIVSWAYDMFDFNSKIKSDLGIADIYIKANRLLNEKPEYNIEIDNLMKKVESVDESTINNFNYVVNLALNGIKETLGLMNIKHDKFIKESTFVINGSVLDIINKLKKTKYIKNDNNLCSLDLSNYGFKKDLIIQRSNGTSLYTTRDIAYHQWKGVNFDRIINILGSDHKLISSQLEVALTILNLKIPETVIFEFVSLPTGSMSTREGKFITADDVISKTIEKSLFEVEKRNIDLSNEIKYNIAKSIAVGAIRYDIIKVSPEKSTTFNWKQALTLDKKGGPYIQYAYARASNIIQKCQYSFDI